MFKPANRLPAPSGTLILQLPGQSALSAFRRRKLLDTLWQAGGDVTDLTARFTYYVILSRDLQDAEQARLQSLLLSDETVPEIPAESVRAYVLPRRGTISPWSSKASDIVKACGLNAVTRIERGVCYGLRAGRTTTAAMLEETCRVLYDRMTEDLVTGLDALDGYFEEHDAAPLRTVRLLDDGVDALRRADRELGLAISEQEISYLADAYERLGRDPTDAELMMFAQANSEHCRHKIFNADWTIDGEPQRQSLFGMIRSTTEASPDGVISAYSDNAAVIEGPDASRLVLQAADRQYAELDEAVHFLMKVETHNHPTAISPFPGAATGSGGEIRDEGATGLGARPKAGLTGFSVSHLRIPGFEQPWELPFGRPERIASPLEIMLDGPIGGAAFNNEFGRPNLLGYFRSFESPVPGLPSGEIRGYHKPIMIAGGVGNVRAEHALKTDVPSGAKIVVLGGPAMMIGLGGGAASSLSSGSSSEDLDFASVQRGNPEMQRRAQEVIDACCSMGRNNPVLLIHDVGAGGLSNAIPEAVDHSHLGAAIELRDVPSGERGMSPMAIWCNEAQERYVLIVADERIGDLEKICRRERCPYAVVGNLTTDRRLRVSDREFGNHSVDMPMDVLLGNPPRMTRSVQRLPGPSQCLSFEGIELEEAIFRVLRFPAVGDKSFLIHIADRTVGGLCARDQLIGPWQVPVSDVAITSTGFSHTTGEAMAMGERTPLAVIDAPASGRIAVCEAITNIAAAAISDLGDVKLSANWMAAAGHPGEDARLFDTVRAVAHELCRELGVAIPVGKDSLSMRTAWRDEQGDRQVVAPVSLIVSAFAPVTDVTRHLTPQLARIDEASRLVLLDIADGSLRLGGSCLAQVYNLSGGAVPDLDCPRRLKGFFAAVQELRRRGLLLAYHDRSDGGLLASVAEMMFAGRLGVSLTLAGSGEDLLRQLFAEEPGAVIQVADNRLSELYSVLQENEIGWVEIGSVRPDDQLSIYNDDELVLRLSRTRLQRAWSETSFRLQSIRDNPDTAQQEYDSILDEDDPGLCAHLSFELDAAPEAPAIGRQRPRVALLREQGVNSQYEMAAAFLRAGFAVTDLHMSDLADGRDQLDDYQGLVACGGFSFGDVLGAGGGWAKSILYRPRLRDQFAAFFERAETFGLGVCNGCQMLSLLKELIPGAQHWPRFLRNESEQFEARLSLVEVAPSTSLFLAGMHGSCMPIATSHGEGRAVFEGESAARASNVALRYVDNYGRPTERYPANPNGSVDGICGLCTDDGRVTIMMPHPERVALTRHNSWHPPEWGEEGPWMQMFRNAFAAVS